MLFKITLCTWKRGYVISEIRIGEYDEFRISRNLDFLVPYLKGRFHDIFLEQILRSQFFARRNISARVNSTRKKGAQKM